MAAVGDENICGLDVAVNDSFGVSGFECVVDFDGEIEELIDFQGLGGDSFLERLALEEFHHDEDLAFVAADFMNGANVGVVEGGRSAGFALEAFQRLLVVGQIFGEKFQRNETSQSGVFGLVNNAHPAATQLFENAVVRDRTTNHSGQLLGALVRQGSLLQSLR